MAKPIGIPPIGSGSAQHHEPVASSGNGERRNATSATETPSRHGAPPVPDAGQGTDRDEPREQERDAQRLASPEIRRSDGPQPSQAPISAGTQAAITAVVESSADRLAHRESRRSAGAYAYASGLTAGTIPSEPRFSTREPPAGA
jgi:hypothetical protein